MKAVILAAGKGTRMQPLTFEKPKPLLEVLGKPLIRHMIDMLPEEVDQLVVGVGYMGQMIRDYLGVEWKGKPIIYFEQRELNGPFGALQLVKDELPQGERFFFLFADDIYDEASFKSLLKYPRAALVATVEHPERFGIVITDAENKITDIEEKPAAPKSNLAVTGAYILDSHIFEYEPEPHSNGEFYLPPVILKMIKDYPMYAERASRWIPIGYPEDLAAAEAILVQKGVS